MKVILNKAGIAEDQMEAFDSVYEENVGEGGRIQASNIIARRKFEVHTPDITITVSPERSDLVEEKIIDGRRCLVIPITDELLVNGIRIAQRS